MKNNDWVGPENEQELKQFIAAQESKRLKRMGIDQGDTDGLFVCERDQQPFKIRWSQLGHLRAPPIPIIFESTGVNGKFNVGFTGNIIREVDQTEYEKLWKGESDESGSMVGGNRPG
ncbi:MAG: hypothetical protein AAGA30_19620 [Planctomycetota bacterium]